MKSCHGMKTVLQVSLVVVLVVSETAVPGLVLSSYPDVTDARSSAVDDRLAGEGEVMRRKLSRGHDNVTRSKHDVSRKRLLSVCTVTCFSSGDTRSTWKAS